MIAKIESISEAHTINSLKYCEQGGELIYTNLCLGSSRDIYLQMLENNSLNDRASKPSFHAKIRIAPEDQGKLNTQDWIDISNDYAATIGFHNNPFAIYIHEEGTDKEHCHIIASRIKPNNLVVSDSYTHYDNMDFCRELEQNNKYNLRKVKRVLESMKNNEVFKSSDKRIEPLKEKIFKAIEMSDSMEDVIFHLKNEGIKVKIGRGIGFADGGVYYKGSFIDYRLSLAGIKKLLSYENQEKQFNNNDFKSSLDNSNKENNQKLSDTPSSKSHIKIHIIAKNETTLSTQELLKISNSYASELGMTDNSYSAEAHKGKSKNEYNIIIIPKINDFEFRNDSVEPFSKEIKEKYNLQKIDIVFKEPKIGVSSNTNSIPFPEEKKTQFVNTNHKLNVNSTSNSKILNHLEIRISPKRGSKINPQTLQKISNMCAAEYDLKNNQFNVYVKETDNEVLLIKPKMNIDFNNCLAISQSDIFCTKIEKAFNLQKFEIVPKASSFNDEIYKKVDLKSVVLKEKIIAISKTSRGSKNFKENLKKQGIQVQVNNDIIFSDKKTSIKASLFDQRLSHKGLDEIISNNDTLRGNLVSESTENFILELIFDMLQTLFNSNIELDESDDFEKKKRKKRKKGRKL